MLNKLYVQYASLLKVIEIEIEIEIENRFLNTIEIEIENPFFVMIEIEIENPFSNDFPIAWYWCHLAGLIKACLLFTG